MGKNMKTKNNKMIIFGIILIFFGASVVSGITNNTNVNSNQFINFNSAINAANEKLSYCGKLDYSIINSNEIYRHNPWIMSCNYILYDPIIIYIST